MFALVSDTEALRYLVAILIFLVAVAAVLAIINLVLSINNRLESKKMDLERFEKRRKERWRDR